MEIDESEEEEHPDVKSSHQVHVASEDEDLPSQQDATTHTTDAEARVPVVRHPEFVFGGKWARTKHEAVSTSDSPTEACHATTILHLDKKQVLMAWFGGTYEGAEDVGIWVSKRDESGWEYPHLAAKVFRDAPYRGKNLKGNGPYNKAEPPRQGREPHWNPVLWCSGAGRGDGDGAGYGVCKGEIILYFKIGWKIPEWETYVTKSNDQGLSWSTPTPLFEHDKGGRGPVKNKNILLSDGSWLAPASLEGPKPGVGRRRVWRAFVDASDDHGETWVKGPELTPEEAGWGVIQPSLWESAPGHVHMMLRSSRGGRAPIWRSDSTDGGKTWGKVYRTDMPNNNSGLDVCKLPHSGTLVMAYNPTTENRYPLQLALSEDNGVTWTLGYNVETEGGEVKEGHEYSYPAIVPWPADSPEEGFSVSWTWHRQHVVYLSISLEELKEHAKPIVHGKVHQ